MSTRPVDLHEAHRRRQGAIEGLDREQLERLCADPSAREIPLKALKARIVSTWGDNTAARLMDILRERRSAPQSTEAAS